MNFKFLEPKQRGERVYSHSQTFSMTSCANTPQNVVKSQNSPQSIVALFRLGKSRFREFLIKKTLAIYAKT